MALSLRTTVHVQRHGQEGAMQQAEQKDVAAGLVDHEHNLDGNHYHHVRWLAYHDAGGILRLGDDEVMELEASPARYDYDDARNVSEMNGTSSETTWHIAYRDIGDVELFKGYPTVLLHFASVCCMLFVLIGVPGNLITIIALNTCKKVSANNLPSSSELNLPMNDQSRRCERQCVRY